MAVNIERSVRQRERPRPRIVAALIRRVRFLRRAALATLGREVDGMGSTITLLSDGTKNLLLNFG
ncbi:MAG TPA: hypothetical protein VIU63_01420 [Nitrospira sp.]